MKIKRWYRGKLGEPCPIDEGMAHTDDGDFVLYSDFLDELDRVYGMYSKASHASANLREENTALAKQLEKTVDRLAELSIKYSGAVLKLVE